MKKLRRQGIADIAAANAFLETAYWADHNRRFAQVPTSLDDFHARVPRPREGGRTRRWHPGRDHPYAIFFLTADAKRFRIPPVWIRGMSGIESAFSGRLRAGG